MQTKTLFNFSINLSRNNKTRNLKCRRVQTFIMAVKLLTAEG
jgi:hypothetical protein